MKTKNRAWALFFIILGWVIAALSHYATDILAYSLALIPFAFFLTGLHLLACSFAAQAMIAWGWMFALEFVWLHWFVLQEVSPWISLAAKIIAGLIVGGQFAAWVYLLRRLRPTLFHFLLSAIIWGFLEWQRIFWTGGLSYAQVGFPLLKWDLSLQLAAYVGAFGLSVVAMWINLLFFKVLVSGQRSFFPLYCVMAIPLIGSLRMVYHDQMKESALPDHTEITCVTEGDFAAGLIAACVHGNPSQAIVLPEGSFSHPHDKPIFPKQQTITLFKPYFSEKQILRHFSGSSLFYTTEELLRAASHLFDRQIIAGVVRHDQGKLYNSIICFLPYDREPQWYDKQKLLPLTESDAFYSIHAILKKWGIEDLFTAGRSHTFFKTDHLIAPLVCFEEQFSELFHAAQRHSPDYFLTLSNESWITHPQFRQWRLIQAKARAVEFGIPLVRVVYQGQSAVIDPLGKITWPSLVEEKGQRLSISFYQNSTFFSLAGDFWLFYAMCAAGFFFLVSLVLKSPFEPSLLKNRQLT